MHAGAKQTGGDDIVFAHQAGIDQVGRSQRADAVDEFRGQQPKVDDDLKARDLGKR